MKASPLRWIGLVPIMGLKVLVLTLGGFLLPILLPIFPWALVGRGEIAIANPTPPRCDGLISGENLAQQTLPQVKGTKEKAVQAEHFPPPSLWWAKEQYDPFGGRLIEDWKTDANLQQIDLQVNRQLWSSLDYVNRYQFVNKFGNIAREKHYNLRILTAQNKCLAIYSCRFDAIPNQCDLLIEATKSSGFRVNPLLENEPQ